MLAYKHYGKTQGTPLVMIHGFLCSGVFFEPNIQQLQKQHRIITIDLPGFGNSSQTIGKSSIREMATELIKTLDFLRLKTVHLLGHSMGGMVAMQSALMLGNRIDKLIIYASNSDGNLTQRFESFNESKKRLDSNFHEAKKTIIASWFCQATQHPDFPLVESCSTTVQLITAVNAINAMQHFNITKDLAKLTQDILIIAAEYDRTYTEKNIKKLRQNLPQAAFSLMKNCAHNAHLEDKQTFNSLIHSFLHKSPHQSKLYY